MVYFWYFLQISPSIPGATYIADVEDPKLLELSNLLMPVEGLVALSRLVDVAGEQRTVGDSDEGNGLRNFPCSAIVSSTELDIPQLRRSLV